MNKKFKALYSFQMNFLSSAIDGATVFVLYWGSCRDYWNHMSAAILKLFYEKKCAPKLWIFLQLR